ncbi:MutS-related protein [Terrimonas ferruginea]|uniref:MutS-related protein n=1 Tax=Terrimonas ferruginea TaxID=249 RepID=UPI000425251A|nr:DNA mismatch repair protein MutS [Terrimonas ferruginea]
MQIDNISINDISIFHQEEEFSIFHRMNFTRTSGGKAWLYKYFNEPFSDIQKIRGTQDLIRTLLTRIDKWPSDISNGTLLVMDKFLDYPLDPVGAKPNELQAALYRLLHGADYSMIKYSVTHFADFFRGLKVILGLLEGAKLPAGPQLYVDRANQLLREEALNKLSQIPRGQLIDRRDNLYFAHNLRVRYRHSVLELMEIFGRLDAWYSMAMAVKTYNLSFPEFVEQETPLVEARQLYHIMLPNPVPYDLLMNPQHHFLFLTGANMAGKSTLIKSVGAAVFLAHLGMGVPAGSMRLTLFDGLVSNINVMDNIAKGESYFFNEVQRIKNTIEKINNGKKWLVLIDELFKGTNVQDAMKCSLAVIRGLLRIRNALFILSTHLYEIGEELKDQSSITFRYFETNVHDDQLSFSYQLRNGISNDRIGYVILKREKVVEMLEKL